MRWELETKTFLYRPMFYLLIKRNVRSATPSNFRWCDPSRKTLYRKRRQNDSDCRKNLRCCEGPFASFKNQNGRGTGPHLLWQNPRGHPLKCSLAIKMGDVVTKIAEPVQLMWRDMCVFCCDDLTCESVWGCCSCSCQTHPHEENDLIINDDGPK